MRGDERRMPGPTKLDYGQMMQRAMRGLLAEVLGTVAEYGLPGDHHLYIGFDTTHPGVDISTFLLETYPEEMTIVLQHEFRDLAVMGDRFQVTLSFSGVVETLVIPLDAVTTFVDPSVEFGLKFEAHDADEVELIMPEGLADQPAKSSATATEDEDPDDGPKGGSAEVVSLDQFRKT